MSGTTLLFSVKRAAACGFRRGSQDAARGALRSRGWHCQAHTEQRCAPSRRALVSSPSRPLSRRLSNTMLTSRPVFVSTPGKSQMTLRFKSALSLSWVLFQQNCSSPGLSLQTCCCLLCIRKAVLWGRRSSQAQGHELHPKQRRRPPRPPGSGQG